MDYSVLVDQNRYCYYCSCYYHHHDYYCCCYCYCCCYDYYCCHCHCYHSSRNCPKRDHYHCWYFCWSSVLEQQRYLNHPTYHLENHQMHPCYLQHYFLQHFHFLSFPIQQQLNQALFQIHHNWEKDPYFPIYQHYHVKKIMNLLECVIMNEIVFHDATDVFFLVLFVMNWSDDAAVVVTENEINLIDTIVEIYVIDMKNLNFVIDVATEFLFVKILENVGRKHHRGVLSEVVQPKVIHFRALCY